MNPCKCRDRGPVVVEQDGPGEVRVVCCYCWRKTETLGSKTAAIAAWNAGRSR